jgi:hypothetical protein
MRTMKYVFEFLSLSWSKVQQRRLWNMLQAVVSATVIATRAGP